MGQPVPERWPCGTDPDCFDGSCEPMGCLQTVDWSDNGLDLIFEPIPDMSQPPVIKLIWSIPEGVSAFRVARTTNGTVPELNDTISEVDEEENHFGDNDLQKGDCYRYRVFAMNACSEPIASSEIADICVD